MHTHVCKLQFSVPLFCISSLSRSDDPRRKYNFQKPTTRVGGGEQERRRNLIYTIINLSHLPKLSTHEQNRLTWPKIPFRKKESLANLLTTKKLHKCFRFGWFGYLMFFGGSCKLFSEVIKIKIVTLCFNFMPHWS